jgi:hypothetical protein
MGLPYARGCAAIAAGLRESIKEAADYTEISTTDFLAAGRRSAEIVTTCLITMLCIRFVGQLVFPVCVCWAHTCSYTSGPHNT